MTDPQALSALRYVVTSGPLTGQASLDCEDVLRQFPEKDTTIHVTALPPDDSPPEALDVRAAAEWIVREDDMHHHPDNACAECVPGGPILIEGFRCTPHQARAFLGFGSFTALSSTPKEPTLQIASRDEVAATRRELRRIAGSTPKEPSDG